MNNISVGSELAAFLKQSNHRISAIRPLEAGDSYVKFIPLINRYRIFTDISGNYADSIGSAARIIVESLVEELTKEELFEKFANQIMQFKRREAYQMQYKDLDKSPSVMESPHFNNYALTYNFIESIDESGKVTFEKIGYKLRK